MIDILSVKAGDRIEYQSYRCSESLRDERFTGIYQDYMFWSPDERPIELWLNLIGQEPRNMGMKIFIRASQVTNVYAYQEGEK
jgi:hypothetical protein